MRRSTERMATTDFGRKLFREQLAGGDAFVVAEVDAVLAKPAHLRVNELGVRVGVAHEDIGLIAIVGREWLLQRTPPASDSSYRPHTSVR